MNFLVKIWIAFILDLIFGDPINVTHPVQIIWKLIDFLAKKLYTKKEEETEEFDVEEKKIGKDKNNKTLKNISQEIKKRNFGNGMLMNICVIFITFVSMLILEKLSQKNIIFTFLISLSISIASRTVGVLMVSSLMVIPVACALRVSKSYFQTVIYSILFGMLFTIAGIVISFYQGLKPGGTMVLTGIVMLVTIVILQNLRKLLKI